MKSDEKGFSLIELVVVVALSALVSAAGGSAIFQILRGTDRNNDHMTAVRQVENAGYWISRDAQMAHTVTTTNLTSPDFLLLGWTEWNKAGDSYTATYHSATYFFDNVTDGIGKLKRVHWINAVANEQTLIAQYIYYDLNNSENTSRVSYQSPVLTLQLTSRLGETMETREYQIKHRPNF